MPLSLAGRLPPELWTQIASHVQDQATLYSLSLTSCRCHSAALPHLYGRPRFSTHQALRLFWRACRGRVGDLVRHLNLTLLDVYWNDGEVDGHKDCLIELYELPHLCPNLETLKCRLSISEATTLIRQDKSRGPKDVLCPMQSWLQQDAPWSDSLRSLNLDGSRLSVQTYSQVHLLPFFFNQHSDGSMRALTSLDLSRTNASDSFVCHILTDPSFRNLKSLSLAYCRSLTDDVVEPLRQAFTPSSLKEPSIIWHPDDVAGTAAQDPEQFLRLTNQKASNGRWKHQKVTVRLESLDLTGTYLMGLDGVGDYWEDESEGMGSVGGYEMEEEGFQVTGEHAEPAYQDGEGYTFDFLAYHDAFP